MYEYNVKYNRLLIFDGSYCLHRNLSEPNQFEMKTSTGIGTGGVLGVLRTIQKELKSYNYYPVVVFDGGLSKRRLNIFPNYKKNLEKQQQLNECWENKTEEQLAYEDFMREYRTQRNILMELLPLLGIPTIRLENWEGDDLMYIISKMCLNSVVVTDDKDLIQLIHEPTLQDVRKCCIRRALNDEFWTMETLKQQGQNIQEYIGCKSIVGDPSDNLASACEGVGGKTAPGLYKLIEQTQKNAIQFPKTEEELDTLCKQYNIPKRKSYLNLNIDQFVSNYLMTDLRFVDEEITKDVIINIEEKIKYNDLNYETDFERINEINNMLENLEINIFRPSSLINRLKELKDMIKVEDNIKVANISETRTYQDGLF